jgi:AraC family transcriptional regulator of arabinose operon
MHMERWESYLPLMELAHLDIIRYGLHRHEQFAVTGRTFNYYGVSYMSKGSSQVRFAEETLELRAGDAFLIPPGVRHDHVKTGEGVAEFLWWDFRFDVAGCVDALKPFRLPRKVHMDDQTQFARLFGQFMRLMEHPKSPSGVLLLKARAMELMAMILEEAFSSAQYQMEDESADIIPSMVMDVKNNCTARAILPLLAEKYRLHPTYLSNRFTQVLGVSPAQLQSRFRLERAKELLLTHALNVSEIAGLLGYENSNNFTRFFRRETGVTPSQWRASAGEIHL